MSEVKVWTPGISTGYTAKTRWLVMSSDGRSLFHVDDATPEQVRWVCALPQIMAALQELYEARSDADEASAFNKLTALYERLK